MTLASIAVRDIAYARLPSFIVVADYRKNAQSLGTHVSLQPSSFLSLVLILSSVCLVPSRSSDRGHPFRICKDLEYPSQNL